MGLRLLLVWYASARTSLATGNSQFGFGQRTARWWWWWWWWWWWEKIPKHRRPNGPAHMKPYLRLNTHKHSAAKRPSHADLVLNCIECRLHPLLTGGGGGGGGGCEQDKYGDGSSFSSLHCLKVGIFTRWHLLQARSLAAPSSNFWLRWAVRQQLWPPKGACHQSRYDEVGDQRHVVRWEGRVWQPLQEDS